MPPTPPELLASNHPGLSALLWIAAGLYAVTFLVSAVRPALGRWPAGCGAAVHVAATAGRGLAIGFFPLTNKVESFSAAALSLALVIAVVWVPVRLYLLPLLGLLLAVMAAALRFPLDLAWPPPLMRTIWYPLHVPLSFVCYAIWAAAAAAALAWWRDRDTGWLSRIDRLALWGFSLWSLSMVTGGIWGVVAWGAYFMWDPKIVWSAILWFHYATFLHVRLTPSMQGRTGLRPALAAVGFAFVVVAYLGTSFLFGRSSHAFS
jgi:Cytochrome C assembly protein